MYGKRAFAAAMMATGFALGLGEVAASEPVATISNVTGVALVNQGAEYVNATPGMALREGARLMAMEGGSVRVTFNNGCVHELADNTVLTVGSAESCAAGTLASKQVGPYVAAAPAAVGASGVAGATFAGLVATTVLLGSTDVIETGSEDRSSVSP